ncbi:MAG: nucleotidyltransferase domain-containing protein [Actinobacteria bacterium]|nr:nucleotidyltransferase domain-containing protein [Actinomycetota bacterium]
MCTTTTVSNWATDEIKKRTLSVVAGTGVRVWLFGSRAWGGAKSLSDFDLALEAPLGRVADSVRVALREALETSRIPYEVDIVDLADASAELRAAVKEKGILWTD